MVALAVFISQSDTAVNKILKLLPVPRYRTRKSSTGSMARDDSPASSMAAASSTAAAAAQRPQCAVKWDRNLKPKLA